MREITVIGAGIVGLAVACYLQRDGHRVTVVDRREPGEECSFGNAGSLSASAVVPLATPGLLWKAPRMLLDPEGPIYIRPGHFLRAMPWFTRFALAARPRRVEEVSQALHALIAPAIEAYEPLLQELGDNRWIRRTGQLQLYRDKAALRRDPAAVRLRRARGVRVEEVDADDIRQLEPAVGPDYRCGLFLPDDGQVIEPYGFVQALAGMFVRNGGRILRRNVTRIATGPDGPESLHTDSGEMAVDRLVIAAGAWSHILAAQLGSRVPLESERGYHVTITAPGVELRRTVGDAARKVFATPLESGLRLAGTAEFAGLEAPPDYRRARILVELGRRLLPGLEAKEVSEWMGQRPALPDSLPVIGPSPHFPRVFHAFGHGHLGLTAAAATGRIVADVVTRRTPPIDIRPYCIDRF